MIYLTIIGLIILITRFKSNPKTSTEELSQLSKQVYNTQLEAYKITQQPGYKSCTDEEWELLIKRLQETRKINYLKQYN